MDPFSRKSILLGTLLFIIFVAFWKMYSMKSNRSSLFSHKMEHSLYPYQRSYWKYYRERTEYRISIVSDMDKLTKVQGSDLWSSHYLHGTLTRNADNTFSIEWDSNGPEILLSRFNDGNRGMELSELSFFNDKIYSGCDRTGIVYELYPETKTTQAKTISVPRTIMMDGDGNLNKGLKIEWATVKDDKLYVGSVGKEWVQTGMKPSNNPMWVKTIDTNGHLEHHNWESIYQKLRVATETTYPGYLIHEAVSWEPITRRWFFFPRRVSYEEYDEDLDEERCGNIGLAMDEEFQHVEVIKNVGVYNKLHGFSTMKFVPFSSEEVVALKTQERPDLATYIMVVNIRTGAILMPETRISEIKYEGLEFV